MVASFWDTCQGWLEQFNKAKEQYESIIAFVDSRKNDDQPINQELYAQAKRKLAFVKQLPQSIQQKTIDPVFSDLWSSLLHAYLFEHFEFEDKYLVVDSVPKSVATTLATLDEKTFSGIQYPFSGVFNDIKIYAEWTARSVDGKRVLQEYSAVLGKRTLADVKKAMEAVHAKQVQNSMK